MATVPCVCVGGGGGCKVTNTTVAEYLSAFGYVYNDSDPLNDTYQSIISSVATKNNLGSNTAWKALCEACLRARALLYCSNTPGDCGTTRQAVNTAALQNLQTLGVAGSLAGQGIKIGSEIASLAGLGGTLLSGITFGASALLQGILQIFQNHAAAEQKQATALCQLCPQVTAAIISTDAAIYAGSDSQSAGIANIQTIATQFRTAVQPLTHGDDAFFGYSAICDALALESNYTYMLAFSGQSTPVTAAEPVNPATQTTASATVTSASGVGAQNIPVASTGINAAIVPQTNLLSSLPSYIWLLLGAAVIIAFMGGERSQEAA